MALGRKPWIPQKLLHKEVSSKLFKKIFEKGEQISRILEKLIKPRGSFFCKHSWSQPIHGLMIAVSGLLLALPLPPGTNFPPALAAIFLCVGSLEEDAVMIFAGYGMFAINIVFFGALFFFGTNFVRVLLGT